MHRPILLAALLLLPVAALSQTTLVDDLRACGAADLDAADFNREEVTTLTEEGIYMIEYSCTFAQPIVFDWSHGEPIVRAGYCMEPGPYIYPTVFVIGLWPGEVGRAHVWEQDAQPLGEARIFEACGE